MVQTLSRRPRNVLLVGPTERAPYFRYSRNAERVIFS
jgi:hypothetical protein